MSEKKRSRLSLLCPAIALTLCATLGGCGEAGPPGAPAAATPAWATPERLIGRTMGEEQVDVQIHLRLRNQDAAEAEMYELNDPASPRYGLFLSAEAFRARYAPSDSDVAEVIRWLAEQGLGVDSTAESRLFVHARGTVSRVEAAFSTRLGRYRVGEQVLRAPMDPPTIPTQMAPLLATVLGLSDSSVVAPQTRPGGAHPFASSGGNAAVQGAADGTAVPPPPGSRDGQPCSRWWNEVEDRVDPTYGGGFPAPLPYITCGYTPPRLRAAYGFSQEVRQGNDGSGVTVAIVAAFAASPNLLLDAQTYAAQNDPDYPLDASHLRTILGPGTDPVPPPPPGLVQAWWQNQTQSVEALHGMAPGARILYVGSRSPADADQLAALDYVITHDLASLVASPWTAGPESGVLTPLAYQAVAIHAGLRGIGLFFPSGDNGDNGPGAGAPGPVSPDFPASLPQVTAVGGTALGIGRLNNREFEVGAETGISVLQQATLTYSPPAPGAFFLGSGGGTSRVYLQPRYQRNVVPPALADLYGPPARVVPDVAIVGNLSTGFLLGETQTFPDGVAYGQFTAGDTSLACPLFVGVMALAEQRNRHRVGFANPALYRAAHGHAFHDIVPGPLRAVSVVAYDNGLDAGGGVTHIVAPLEFQGLTIHPAPGYDNVTGLGSPDGASFLREVR